MNIGELKKVIADMPDDVEIFLEGSGHVMRVGDASDWKVSENAADRGYYQYFDAEALGRDETAIRALIIS